MRYLFIIPARGGSKGLKGKNIKDLCGKPLILYSLQYARLFTDDSNICVTTDSQEIADVVRSARYTLPFLRPDNLSGDATGMRDVLIHAIDTYEEKGYIFDGVVLLQPTSPFRCRHFFEEASSLFTSQIDMVVAVNESKANPYFNLFEENKEGFLQLSKTSTAVSRQETPKIYQYNGNLYVIKINSLRLYDSLSKLPQIVKYVIPAEYGIDIDNLSDWNNAEYLLNNHLVRTDGKL